MKKSGGSKGGGSSGKGTDRHRHRGSLRAPVVYIEALRQLARRNDRTIGLELLRALDAHLRAEGIEPPDRSSEG